MNNEVWVVYGRNRAARDLIFSILHAVSLEPLDFDDVGQLTGSTSPYIGDVLAAAFDRAQAFVVLLTDDEEVCLREELRGEDDPDYVEYQARPNVIFEAGMGMALHPDRTIIIEMGSVRRLTDLSGRHVIRWRDGSPEKRLEFLEKLKTAGCPVNYRRKDWMTVRVASNSGLLTNPPRRPCGSLQEGTQDVSAEPEVVKSPQGQLVEMEAIVEELAARTKVGWSTEQAANFWSSDAARELLTVADRQLEAIRLSPFVRDRPALNKSIDQVRAQLKRHSRERPPGNEFRTKEFWWHGDEIIERLVGIERMLKAMIEHGVDPSDGEALHRLRGEKACIRLAPGPDHRIVGRFRNTDLLVELPLRNEGRGRAYDVKLLSINSELDQEPAHIENVVINLDPDGEGRLFFTFKPSYVGDPPRAQEGRFRLRIGFRDGIGSDEAGYVVSVREEGKRSFRGDAIPERTVASPLCPSLFAEPESRQ